MHYTARIFCNQDKSRLTVVIVLILLYLERIGETSIKNGGKLSLYF